jgi:iron-sulfur cluster repair protein YtfE (RIC family)
MDSIEFDKLKADLKRHLEHEDELLMRILASGMTESEAAELETVIGSLMHAYRSEKVAEQEYIIRRYPLRHQRS